MRSRLYDPSDLVTVNGKTMVRSVPVRLATKVSPEAPLRGSAPAPVFRSKWELAYSKQLEAERLAGEIVGYWYEPFSIWLPGKVRYKPDFLVQRKQELELIEVKGWSKNRRDGMTRLKIAAALFPCFTWRLVWKEGHGFDGQYITA